ncbi:MAG: sortase B protein-sorting domain-containing protein [Clostridia bacterium]|nr:sortase B protein-sorting domain-containing protein [Clostridia bacterium]
MNICTAAPTAEPTPEPKDDLPQTGDSSRLAIWCMLLIASSALLLFRKRSA